MLLIFCHKETPRITYTFSFCLQNLKTDWEVTDNIERYTKHDGASLNYSPEKIKSGEIHICPHRIMTTDVITALDEAILEYKNIKVLFPTSSGTIPFDLFANVFFHLSRYEEYLPFEEDEHNRFSSKQSWLFRTKQLETAPVDQLCKVLEELLSSRYDLKFNQPKATALLTIDLDNAYAFKGKGVLRNTAGLIKDGVRFSKTFQSRCSTLFRSGQDPYDSYDYQLEMAKKLQIKLIYFILLGDYSKYDKNLSWKSKAIRQLIHFLKKKASIGIHPSYGSFLKPSQLKKETKRLKFLKDSKVTKSRNHYLRFRIPNTYEVLLEDGIEEDYSMGYADTVGFRAGTTRPFPFFNLKHNTATELMIYPITFMDGTLHEHMGLSIEEAKQKISELYATVQQHGGCFVALWHNDTLAEANHWKGWREVFEWGLTLTNQHK